MLWKIREQEQVILVLGGATTLKEENRNLASGITVEQSIM